MFNIVVNLKCFEGKTTPMGIEKFDRASWKLIQNSMNDSGKFVDMLHNVPWEDGLNMNDIGGQYNNKVKQQH